MRAFAPLGLNQEVYSMTISKRSAQSILNRFTEADALILNRSDIPRSTLKGWMDKGLFVDGAEGTVYPTDALLDSMSALNIELPQDFNFQIIQVENELDPEYRASLGRAPLNEALQAQLEERLHMLQCVASIGSEPTTPEPAPETLEGQLAEQVQEHALEHYNEAGWDIVYETMTITEIADQLEDAGIKTLDGALKLIGGTSKIQADHRDDARVAGGLEPLQDTCEPIDVTDDQRATLKSLMQADESSWDFYSHNVTDENLKEHKAHEVSLKTFCADVLNITVEQAHQISWEAPEPSPQPLVVPTESAPVIVKKVKVMKPKAPRKVRAFKAQDDYTSCECGDKSCDEKATSQDEIDELFGWRNVMKGPQYARVKIQVPQSNCKACRKLKSAKYAKKKKALKQAKATA